MSIEVEKKVRVPLEDRVVEAEVTVTIEPSDLDEEIVLAWIRNKGRFSSEVEILEELGHTCECEEEEISLIAVKDYLKWADDHEIKEIMSELATPEYGSQSSLESLFRTGAVSYFDIVEFVKNHASDLKVHTDLFPHLS